jgi:hypothetical protein
MRQLVLDMVFQAELKRPHQPYRAAVYIIPQIAQRQMNGLTAGGF